MMLTRLSQAFGFKYCLLVVCIYGLNQGMSEGLAGYALQYLLTDDASKNGFNLSPNVISEMDGFDNIPWQIKSIYGIVSDFYPVYGYHRTPHIVFSSAVGFFSWIVLALPSSSYLLIAFLVFLGNFSIASPDVYIDGSIAEKCRDTPELGSDLQSLAWGSFGVFKIISLLIAPFFYVNFGARSLFAVTAITSVAVLIGASLGWLGEVKKSTSSSSTASFLEKIRNDVVMGNIVKLSVYLTLVSFSMGLIALFAKENYLLVFLVSTFVCTPMVLGLIWKYKFDTVVAKACMYVFVSGVLQPSSSIMFYWMKQDEYNCNLKLPCFSPDFIAKLSIVGYLFFTLGVAIYNRWLSAFPYKKIYFITQTLMFLVNLLDLFWVLRLNVRFGISDEAFVLSDEVIGPIIARLHAMPFFLLATQLCPKGVEATFFAMVMGLSNFGGTMSEYSGIGLLLLTGVDKHQYDNLPTYVLLRSLAKLLPLLLIPFLIPSGSPLVGVELQNRSRQQPPEEVQLEEMETVPLKRESIEKTQENT